MPEPAVEIAVLADLEAEQRTSVQHLADAAFVDDGVAALNEQSLLRVAHGGGEARHLVATVGGSVVGYGLLNGSGPDPVTAEAVVHPDHRGQGIGTALVRRLIAEAAPAPVRMWAHGHLPGAEIIADRLGLRRVRDLWKMHRRWHHGPLPDVPLPPGVTVRTFRPGEDEPGWLAVNARAFADHPEQGSMTAADLAEREQEPWFDPAGFFLAERDGELVGFHWTKIHGAGEAGEVYVLGIDPAAQGLKLGKALTLVGLRHLRDRGVDGVILYVEATNVPAIKVYQWLGFSHVRTDVMYESH